MVLVINGEAVSGMVRLSDGAYQIHSLSDGRHVISEVEERPSCLSGSTRGVRAANSAGGSPRMQSKTWTETPVEVRPEPHSLIKIAIFYTPAARKNRGGTTNIKAHIDRTIAEANQVYKNNGVHLTLKLVAAQEVNYTEVDDLTDIIRFTVVDDGHMDEIHDVRNRNHADLALLLRNGAGGIVIAVPSYDTEEILEWNAKSLFAAYNGGTYTLLHEIGHLMGAQHDRYESGCEKEGFRCPPSA